MNQYEGLNNLTKDIRQPVRNSAINARQEFYLKFPHLNTEPSTAPKSKRTRDQMINNIHSFKCVRSETFVIENIEKVNIEETKVDIPDLNLENTSNLSAENTNEQFNIIEEKPLSVSAASSLSDSLESITSPVLFEKSSLENPEWNNNQYVSDVLSKLKSVL